MDRGVLPQRPSRFHADEPKRPRTRHVGLATKMNDGHSTKNSEVPLGLAASSVLITLRQFWAMDGLILCFTLSLTEKLLMIRPVSEAHPVVKQFGASPFMRPWTIFMMFILGIPICLLIWLRPVFIRK